MRSSCLLSALSHFRYDSRLKTDRSSGNYNILRCDFVFIVSSLCSLLAKVKLTSCHSQLEVLQLSPYHFLSDAFFNNAAES